MKTETPVTTYYQGTTVSANFFTKVGDLFISAWFFMLLLSAAHSGDARVPAFSYWVSFALVFAIWMAMPAQLYTKTK